jgi:hypothetical protein
VHTFIQQKYHDGELGSAVFVTLPVVERFKVVPISDNDTR